MSAIQTLLSLLINVAHLLSIAVILGYLGFVGLVEFMGLLDFRIKKHSNIRKLGE